MDNKKILLALLPFWTPMIPPQGIASLKVFLQKHGFRVKTIDANTDAKFRKHSTHYFYTLKQSIPGEKQGNFYNIGMDVLRDHMIAAITHTSEQKYREQIKDIVYQTFFTELNNEQADMVARSLQELFDTLEKYIVELLEREKPHVLGLSVLSGTLAASLYTFKLAKTRFPGIKTVMGGGLFVDTHALGSPNFENLLKQTEPYIDKLIIGQGELLFLKYLQGELDSPRLLTRKNIDNNMLNFQEIDLPDFSDFDLKDYPYLSATGSQSCPYECAFCTSKKFYGKYRKKPIQQTVDEMHHLYRLYRRQLFFMTDFLLNPIVTDLSNELFRRGLTLYYDCYLRAHKMVCDINNTLLWRRGGMYRVRLGIESGSQRVLNLMDKNIALEEIKGSISALANVGIKTTVYMITGFPGETKEDFQQTLDLLEEMKDDIWEAEPNPFLYYYNSQMKDHQWSRKKLLLYPRWAREMEIMQSWTLDIEPFREGAFSRQVQFIQHCKKLGIPNPYSLQEHFEADERWKRLHKNAVPSLLEFQKKDVYINECQELEMMSFAENTLKKDGDFNFFA